MATGTDCRRQIRDFMHIILGLSVGFQDWGMHLITSYLNYVIGSYSKFKMADPRNWRDPENLQMDLEIFGIALVTGDNAAYRLQGFTTGGHFEFIF